MDEIEALKDHLALRSELTRRAQSASAQVYERMTQSEKMLQEQIDDQKAISADMTRQYKTMQTEMGLRIHQLETELGKTQAHLEHAKFELQQAREEKDRSVKDRDEEISELKMKVSSMEKAYEAILREALDGLMAKIDLAHDNWEVKSTNIQGKTKQAVLEFGLNPLDI
ncbi:coiled-coil domain-containing protein 153-like isoform X2 [Pomacea canaliculata]|nr:coiled-coil domain-containing protein 153-like isoform X2 [Pomacea canaliculata]XP_025089618.1 coiled-coil domain-containing protein 153-like isoform X2 [Pomacea canaliculata]